MVTKNNFFFAGTSSQAEPEAKKSLVVVDSRVENYRQLIGGIKAGTEVFVLSQTREAIDQITEILRHRQNINSLHIVSHGREAAIAIGSTELNIDNLETYSNQLQQWGKALSKSASILLYGCNIAAGEAGLKFIQKIKEFTGANIAASQNPTGSAALGGDWKLEITTGQINAELAFEKEVLENYTSVLATLVSEDFKNSTVVGPWIYGIAGTSTQPGLTAGAANSGVIPSLGNNDPAGGGALRLTSNANNQSAYVLYNNPISATGGLRVTFDLFSYNKGTSTEGADGLSFFLINGTATPTKAGGFGGSLGYASNNSLTPALNSEGISGGYLGIGLDEFGNFSEEQPLPPARATFGRVGGPGITKDSIGIRGSESRTYSFITNASVPIGIDNENATNRTDPNTKRSVQITLLPPTSTIAPNRLTVALDLDQNGTFDPGEILIEIADLSTINGIVPSTFKFGFAAATGGSTNIHEVNNILVESIDEPTLQADVSIVKKGPLYAIPSSNIIYTITSTNNGPNSAESVLIQDPLPAGLTFVSADNGGTYDSVTRNVIWPAIPILNGDSEVRTITATVPATPGTILTNTAYSTSSTFDPNKANNNSSQPISQALTTITPFADVVTTKSGTLNSAPGSIVSYDIVTQNNGPSTADNVTITDSIIPGLTGVSISDSGTYDSITGIVTFPLVTLTNTQSVRRSIRFIAPASGSVSNTAKSNSSTPDPTPGNNDGTATGASVTTILTPSADVITTKSGTLNSAPGSIVSYDIVTQNNGPSTADNVTITDSIIPGLTGVSISDSGTYDSITGIVTFPLVTLTNTQSVRRSIRFIAPASGSVSNTAKS
ncbi:DUF4347 domain-containing protein, partial [Microcoleus sp. A2-D5]|uniref:DUF4347 domain-containing protein n=1 Tax=Microcoleus sp. A2-D5 TaxID=2818538 RepID=UPI002FCE8533